MNQRWHCIDVAFSMVQIKMVHFRWKRMRISICCCKIEKTCNNLGKKKENFDHLCIMFFYAISVATNRLLLSTHICQTIHSQAFHFRFFISGFIFIMGFIFNTIGSIFLILGLILQTGIFLTFNLPIYMNDINFMIHVVWRKIFIFLPKKP